MTAELTVVEGPWTGRQFTLSQGEIGIGRNPENGVCVVDASVSRYHCVLHKRNGQYFLSDLQSNNGTLINGNRVLNAILLHSGDRISIGKTTLRFDGSGPESTDELEVEAAKEDSIGPETVVLDIDQAHRMSADFLATISPNELAIKRLEAVLEIGRMLNSEGVASVQERLLSLIGEIVPAESAAIVIAADSGEIRILCRWQRYMSIGCEVHFSRTIVNRVLAGAGAILSNDTSVDSQLRSSETFVTRRITSALCVALAVGDQCRGAVYLESTDPGVRFEQDHLKFLTAISGYAALVLENARKVETLKNENSRLLDAIQLKHDIVGRSKAIQDLEFAIRKLACADATVLIIGESGTGKELTAKALHMNSARSSKPFEAINCALLRGELLEAELFGHEKGAFTGACVKKVGKLEAANGGTVFLDEVAELPLSTQAMLLRVLQEREFTRVGGTDHVKVDIRILTATNKDLEDAVRDRTFRQDLFFRLNVVRLRTPPLRARSDDIPLLAEHFARRSAQRNKKLFSGISARALEALIGYSWPGNVRELENAIEHAVIFGSSGEILREDLPEKILFSVASDSEAPNNYHEAVRVAKEHIILGALAKTGKNYGAAAGLLGIHVNNLHRLIRDFNLKVRILGSEAGHAVNGRN